MFLVVGVGAGADSQRTFTIADQFFRINELVIVRGNFCHGEEGSVSWRVSRQPHGHATCNPTPKPVSGFCPRGSTSKSLEENVSWRVNRQPHGHATCKPTPKLVSGFCPRGSISKSLFGVTKVPLEFRSQLSQASGPMVGGAGARGTSISAWQKPSWGPTVFHPPYLPIESYQ